jgi:hypothetical protein
VLLRSVVNRRNRKTNRLVRLAVYGEVSSKGRDKDLLIVDAAANVNGLVHSVASI